MKRVSKDESLTVFHSEDLEMVNRVLGHAASVETDPTVLSIIQHIGRRAVEVRRQKFDKDQSSLLTIPLEQIDVFNTAVARGIHHELTDGYIPGSDPYSVSLGLKYLDHELPDPEVGVFLTGIVPPTSTISKMAE